jgi:hypothetical protein
MGANQSDSSLHKQNWNFEIYAHPSTGDPSIGNPQNSISLKLSCQWLERLLAAPSEWSKLEKYNASCTHKFNFVIDGYAHPKSIWPKKLYA